MDLGPSRAPPWLCLLRAGNIGSYHHYAQPRPFLSETVCTPPHTHTQEGTGDKLIFVIMAQLHDVAEGVRRCRGRCGNSRVYDREISVGQDLTRVSSQPTSETLSLHFLSSGISGNALLHQVFMWVTGIQTQAIYTEST